MTRTVKARHRVAEDRAWGGPFWSPRLTPEPGFANRGGSLHSYGYVGKHHPEAQSASVLRSTWRDREARSNASTP